MGPVLIVVFDGFQALDAFGPLEVFHGAGYDTELVAPRAGPVASSSGPAVHVGRAMRDVTGPLDTLLVVGGEGTRDRSLRVQLASAVAGLAPHAGRVASVCTGAFVLAEAGLLDERRCTTHWAYVAALARQYPAVRVEADPIFVADGPVWTSAGVTAGIDLALAMVEDDHGPAVARAVAQHLVVYLQRPGGQNQFSQLMSSPVPTRTGLTDLLAWIGEHLDGDCSVAGLAAQASMSPRSLARTFRSQLGTTPAAYVEGCRVEVARQLLETTDLTVAAIARRVGIGGAETLHRVFLRRLRVTPAEYRRRFRARRPPSTPAPGDLASIPPGLHEPVPDDLRTTVGEPRPPHPRGAT